MQFSGDYVLTSNVLEACHCRAGNCAALRTHTGGALSFVQTDGLLVLVDPSTGEMAPGGVDMDGHFRVGFVREQPGDIQYATIDGDFMLSGGVTTSLIAIQEATGKNGPLDCDIRTKFACTYVGALAAFARVPGEVRGTTIGLAASVSGGQP